MTLPLERRAEVPCSRCHYTYRRDLMRVVLEPHSPPKFECRHRDRVRCAQNIAARARLDAWKRGQR